MDQVTCDDDQPSEG